MTDWQTIETAPNDGTEMVECHDAPMAQRALMIEAAFRLEKLKGQAKSRREER